MIVRRSIRTIVMLGVVVIVGAGTYAFTASNSVTAKAAGAGSASISGYSVSNVAYALNAGKPAEHRFGFVRHQPRHCGDGEGEPRWHQLEQLHQHAGLRFLHDHGGHGLCGIKPHRRRGRLAKTQARRCGCLRRPHLPHPTRKTKPCGSHPTLSAPSGSSSPHWCSRSPRRPDVRRSRAARRQRNLRHGSRLEHGAEAPRRRSRHRAAHGHGEHRRRRRLPQPRSARPGAPPDRRDPERQLQVQGRQQQLDRP